MTNAKNQLQTPKGWQLWKCKLANANGLPAVKLVCIVSHADVITCIDGNWRMERAEIRVFFLSRSQKPLWTALERIVQATLLTRPGRRDRRREPLSCYSPRQFQDPVHYNLLHSNLAVLGKEVIHSLTEDRGRRDRLGWPGGKCSSSSRQKLED